MLNAILTNIIFIIVYFIGETTIKIFPLKRMKTISYCPSLLSQSSKYSIKKRETDDNWIRGRRRRRKEEYLILMYSWAGNQKNLKNQGCQSCKLKTLNRDVTVGYCQINHSMIRQRCSFWCFFQMQLQRFFLSYKFWSKLESHFRLAPI